MQINDQISLQKKTGDFIWISNKNIFAFEGECRNARCVSEARSSHFICRLKVEKFPVGFHPQTRFEKEKLLIISQAICPLITQFH